MTAISDLRPRVASEAPNCPNPVIDRALIDAGRQLCTAAPIWQDTITIAATGDDADVLLAGDAIYGVPDADFAAALPSAYALISESRADDGLSEGEMVRVVPPGVMVGGRPFRDYRMTGHRVMHVIHDPGKPMTVHVSVRPQFSDRTLPDVLALDYIEGVTDGALSRVLRMASEPWANPGMAQQYARSARAVRNQAVIDAQRGFEGGSMRVKPRTLSHFRSRR